MLLKVLYAALISIWAVNTPKLIGQSQAFDAGYQAYMRNQFPLAETYFKSALSSATSNTDRAFILKFLGISQFMRGDKRQAAASLYQAYLADPKTSIYEEEVLDPSVVKFYQMLKSRWEQQQTQKSPVPVPPTPVNSSPTVETNKTLKANRPAKKSRPRVVRRRNARNQLKPRVEEASSEKEEEASSSTTSWVHFMPFGAGQFYNEQIGWGSLFAGTQIAFLYLYHTRGQEIKKEEEENSFVLGSTLPQEEIDEFVLKNNSYISGLKNDQNLALIGFGSTWALGIIHAIIYAPEPVIQNKGPMRGKTTLLRPGESQIESDWYAPSSPAHQFVMLPLKDQGWYLQVSIKL